MLLNKETKKIILIFFFFFYSTDYTLWTCKFCLDFRWNEKLLSLYRELIWVRIMVAAVMSILLYGCRLSVEKKFDGNCTRMLWVILGGKKQKKPKKLWKQHPTKQQLYSHLLPISKTIQIKQDIRDTGGGVRKLISEILQWTASHGRGVGQTARTYL